MEDILLGAVYNARSTYFGDHPPDNFLFHVRPIRIVEKSGFISHEKRLVYEVEIIAYAPRIAGSPQPGRKMFLERSRLLSLTANKESAKTLIKWDNEI